MKKLAVLVLTGVMSFTIMACGPKTEGTSGAGTETTGSTVEENESTAAGEETVDAPETEEQPEETTENTETQPEENTENTEQPAEGENEGSDGEYQVGDLDNFDVDSELVAAFGAEVKTAVANQDLEALADLAFFPMYIGFADGGVSVNSREEFIELGAEKIFTQEMIDAIAAADENSLSASRAGFSLTDDGSPNIVFGVADGSLAVMGMNY